MHTARTRPNARSPSSPGTSCAWWGSTTMTTCVAPACSSSWWMNGQTARGRRGKKCCGRCYRLVSTRFQALVCVRAAMRCALALRRALTIATTLIWTASQAVSRITRAGSTPRYKAATFLLKSLRRRAGRWTHAPSGKSTKPASRTTLVSSTTRSIVKIAEPASESSRARLCTLAWTSTS